MADRIVHRGPDDQGFYDAESAVLGMRRLSIIDLDGGQQPICNEERTVWAVCNGEIYNYRELRESLLSRGHTLCSESDVEVIVHLYEEHGRQFVDHIDGMFAIALWDLRAEELVLVRDRLGIKPVYYHSNKDSLVFGSEIKSILAVPGVGSAVDPAGLRDYLTIGYSVAPRTIFNGISKLPPATMLIWSRGEAKLIPYWSIPSETRDDLTESDWLEAIEQGLRDAVSSHMVSDVPIGAFLSGGIDSSTIVALMSDTTSQAVNTYSIGYAGDRTLEYFNELPFANTVAEQFSTNHHQILVQPDVTTLLPRLMWHLEEPISDSAIATTYLVAELAAKSVKVILSGVGGDELFAGYNRYSGDYYQGMYEKLPRWLRDNVARPLAACLPSGRQNRWMDLSRYARRFIEAGSLPWQEQYKYFIAIQGQTMLQELLDDPSLADPDGFDRILSAEGASDPLLRLLRVDWRTQLSEDLLLMTDKITMAESIECRVPFLDHRLVELAATVPARIKRPNRQMKYLLTKAVRHYLPDGVLQRKKRGFGAPVGSWFKGELMPLRSELLSRTAIETRGLLSWKAVDRICGDHDRNRQDYTDLILVLMNLEIWFRLFQDGASADDVGLQLSELAATA